VTTYMVVPVTPDTPEWEAERRNSIGASDVPNILNLPGAYGTPLEVYHSKIGIDRPFDQDRADIGHWLETVMQWWIEKRHPEVGPITPGFMARSIPYPHIHATFDRMAGDIPVQMKSMHYFMKSDWNGGAPLHVQAQVQTEIAVAGSVGAWLVAFIGGVEFRLIWIERDPGFMARALPRLERFWLMVQDRTPPEPVYSAEATELWPTSNERFLDVGFERAQHLIDDYDRYRELQDEAKAANDDLERIALRWKCVMRDDYDSVGLEGQPFFTWRTNSAGVRPFNRNHVKENK